MLDDIREKKTSLTTYILVGMAGVGMLFIGVPFFAISHDNAIAEVNDQDITYNQLQQTVSNIQRSNPDLPLPKAESEALHQLISDSLLAQHAVDSGFYYPDQALYQTIKAQFSDEEEYQRFLTRIGMDAAGYERAVRQDMTTRNYYSILGQAQKSRPEVINTLADNLAQQRSFTIVKLPLEHTLSQTTLSEEAIQTYYENHQEALMEPEEVAVEYVLFHISDLANPDNVSSAALKKARDSYLTQSSQRDGYYLIFDRQDIAEQVQKELAEGASLSSITPDIDSGDKSGEHGKLDLHAKGEGISPLVDDALFALEKSGDVSAVLDTDYGYMIVIADKIQQPEMPDDATLRQQIAEETAQTRYHELTNQAFDAAQSGTDISHIAGMLGVPVQETGLFNQTDLPQSWMEESDVSTQLFGENQVPVGEMAQPVALDEEQSIFFSISKRQEAQLPPLEDIHAEVSALAQRADAEKSLRAQAEAIAKQWASAEIPQQAIDTAQGSVDTYENLAPGQPVDGLDGQTLQALFVQTDQVAVLENSNGDQLIAKLDAVSQGDIEPQIKELIAAQWQRQEQVMSYQGILKWLTSEADIKIYRDGSL